MLYVTTRGDRNVYTAAHALNKNRGSDGGLYVPFKMPRFTPEELQSLAEKPFNHRMAQVLNLIFGCKLAGWDLDFSIGRNPVRLSAMNHRILLGQTWHNPDWSIDRMVYDILKLIRKDGTGDAYASWVETGVRIAVLFGLFGEFMRTGAVNTASAVDVSTVSGDLTWPMAAWYARSWGLPIGTIVICCNENAGLWDLLHRGELRTGQVAADTVTPQCDLVLPRGLERLVFAGGGAEAVEGYLEACRKGMLYCPEDKVLQKMRSGLHVSVCGDRRVLETIANVYAGSKRILGPYASLAYSGLLDYRASSGESRPALVISDRNPMLDADAVCAAMGITNAQLKQLLKQN